MVNRDGRSANTDFCTKVAIMQCYAAAAVCCCGIRLSWHIAWTKFRRCLGAQCESRQVYAPVQAVSVMASVRSDLAFTAKYVECALALKGFGEPGVQPLVHLKLLVHLLCTGALNAKEVLYLVVQDGPCT